MSTPAPFDFNYFPAWPGLALNNGRYTVLRKLGSGVYSSVWLVSKNTDEPGFKYMAAKILTVDGTRRHKAGQMRELEFLETVTAREEVDCLPLLRDHFEEQGVQGPHLCIVMNLLGSDISSFRRSHPKQALPIHIVRNVISMVVEALSYLHDSGIVHTDVKPDNILFTVGADTEKVEKYLAEPPAIEGEFEVNGERHPLLRAQPIPTDFSPEMNAFDAELMRCVLADLGQGQWAGKQPTTDEFSAYPLRAPEVILRSDFGPMLDIWAVGCITFELLVGRWLFHPEATDHWRLEEDHLAKMLEFTSEWFSTAMLDHAALRDEYLDGVGSVRAIPDLSPVSIEEALANYNILPENEIAPAAAFIRECLHLDFRDRPSASELLDHPWLRDAFHC